MPQRLVQLLRESKHTVVLTGAGISTLSGIPDFRSPGGLYEMVDPQKVFDLDYFLHDPSYYYKAMKQFIYELADKQPSIVHTELARLEQLGLVQCIITQNIDLLHHKAGSKNIVEIHGTPLIHRCLNCGKEFEFDWVTARVMADEVPTCTECSGSIKPAITFFGEMLDTAALGTAVQESARASLMLVLGSSLVVYPAASLPAHTLRAGGKLAIINREPTEFDIAAQFRLDDLQEAFEEIAHAL